MRAPSETLRVVKVGGRAQGDPALAPSLAAAWHGAPGALCVVHGGGDEISALQRAVGAEPAFVGGRRVTSERDIELVRMALSGAANKRLAAALVTCGVSALGLSGEDAGLITARPRDGGTLGRVGEPARVDARLLRHLLDGGYLPVISPLSRDATGRDGGALNVNGDDAAAAIAVALGARELLLVADVPGVLIDGVLATVLDAADAPALIARGTAAGGMAAKLQAAVRALEHGVDRVRIGDLTALGDPARGTVVTLERSLV
jgi:acetylglutamate kinase